MAKHAGFTLDTDNTGHYATKGDVQLHCELDEDICAAVDHWLYLEDEKNGTGDFEGWSDADVMDIAADEFAGGRPGLASAELDRRGRAA